MIKRFEQRRGRGDRWLLDARYFFTCQWLGSISHERFIRNIVKRPVGFKALGSSGLILALSLMRLTSHSRLLKRNPSWRGLGKLGGLALNSEVLGVALSGDVKHALRSSARHKCLKTGRAMGLRYGFSRLRLLRDSARGLGPTPPIVRW